MPIGAWSGGPPLPDPAGPFKMCLKSLDFLSLKSVCCPSDRQTLPCGMENHAMRLSPSKKSSGFTLLEIVVVLLVLGIVSTVVISRYVNANADAQNAALMGKITSHLRYARNASMNSDATWWIDFDSGAYRLYKRDAAGTDTSAVFPGEGEPVVDLPDGFGTNINVFF